MFVYSSGDGGGVESLDFLLEGGGVGHELIVNVVGYFGVHECLDG